MSPKCERKYFLLGSSLSWALPVSWLCCCHCDPCSLPCRLPDHLPAPWTCHERCHEHAPWTMIPECLLSPFILQVRAHMPPCQRQTFPSHPCKITSSILLLPSTKFFSPEHFLTSSILYVCILSLSWECKLRTLGTVMRKMWFRGRKFSHGVPPAHRHPVAPHRVDEYHQLLSSNFLSFRKCKEVVNFTNFSSFINSISFAT